MYLSNHRHFGVALGLLLLFIFICLRLENRSKRITLSVATLFGILIGFLPLFHKPVMLMFAVTMATFFVVLPYLRIFLFTTAGIAFVIERV